MTIIHKITFLFLIIVTSFTMSAQYATNSGKYNVKVLVTNDEVPPQFPGGLDSLKQFVFKNYDIEKKGSCSYPGNIVVKFTVEPDGEISDIKFIKPGSTEAYKETLRFIKSMPKWIPVIKNGTAIKSSVSLHFFR